MSQINSRNDWIFSNSKNILKDKDLLIRTAITNMLNKTTSMFEYNGLPPTIPQKDLEIILQVNGNATWKEVDNSLYVFRAGLGGAPNPYYLPTVSIITNPALKYSASLKIDEECVVMLNDYFYLGLMPLNYKYSQLLIEAELSLKQAIINARVPAVIQADNDATKESAELFFKKIVDGEDYGIVSSNEFFDGIKSQDFYKQPYIKDLIEAIQYIKGSWYSELGLNASFNMKREAINQYEASINDDILAPSVDTMLECRQIGLEKVNKMFGTNISVKLNSSWENRKIEKQLDIEEQKSIIKENESVTNRNDDNS